MTPNDAPENEKIIIEPETVVTAKTPVVAVKKERVLIKRRRSGMFDTPEIIAVSAACLLLLSVVVMYLFWLLPAREDVRQSELKRNQMEKELVALREKIGVSTTTESSVTERIDSLNRFETSTLAPAVQANSSLYNRLNELIRVNNLRNTAGPEYGLIAAIGSDKYKADDAATGKGKFQTLYPGTGVSVTVEGSYDNLRRFVAGLENTRQFIVINAIQIESSGDTGGGDNLPAGAGGGSSMTTSGIPPEISGVPNPNGGSKSNTIDPRAAQRQPPGMSAPPKSNAPAATRSQRGIVSMKIELAAYYRRNPSLQPTN